jgi:hypothetical protein
MPFHYEGAYDGFDSFQEVREHYHRCRKSKDFILSQKGVDTEKPNCAYCGKPITSDNRSIFFPKKNKIFVQHYVCAWQSLFNVIFKFSY